MKDLLRVDTSLESTREDGIGVKSLRWEDSRTYFMVDTGPLTSTELTYLVKDGRWIEERLSAD